MPQATVRPPHPAPRDPADPHQVEHPLCLFGSGEQARVVLDAVKASGQWTVKGFWGTCSLPGFPHLGSDDQLALDPSPWMMHAFHVAMLGRPRSPVRRRIIDRFDALGLTWAAVVHPSAVIAPDALIGRGVYVGARAVIQPGARIGDFAVINTGAIVEHDVQVGQGTHLAPGVVTGGGSIFGDWCYFGLGSCLRDHLKIGEDVLVGAGAVVVKDLPSGASVIGNPARPLRGKAF